MSELAALDVLIAALDLPTSAKVGARIPKKTLMEQGAPTAADKKAIQEGVEELQWLAALKPNTIAVSAFADSTRDYSEIAVIAGVFRAKAHETRLTELIHRAIPYPVLLLSVGDLGVSLSVGPKRAAQNEEGKVVVERVVATNGLDLSAPSACDHAFLASLAMAQQPARDLSTLYEGWLARIEALAAARLIGAFQLLDEFATVQRRRIALEDHSRLLREVAALRTKAGRAKQMSRRVDLNQKVKAAEAAIEASKKLMS